MTEPRDAFDQFAATVDDNGATAGSVFAAQLRARVQRALGASQATTDSRSERNTEMSQVITPYICVHDAKAALEWYREFFGATVSNVILWEGRVGHAEFDVAGAGFFLSDEAPDLGVVAPTRDGSQTSVSIVIQVAAVEQFVERATSGGAVVQRPIEAAHGTRSAWIVDPFGHRWNIGTPIYDIEQVVARRAPPEQSLGACRG